MKERKESKVAAMAMIAGAAARMMFVFIFMYLLLIPGSHEPGPAMIPDNFDYGSCSYL